MDLAEFRALSAQPKILILQVVKIDKRLSTNTNYLWQQTHNLSISFKAVKLDKRLPNNKHKKSFIRPIRCAAGKNWL